MSKHWNVANSLITGRFVRRASLPIELALIVLLGILAALLTWELRVLLGSALVGGSSGGGGTSGGGGGGSGSRGAASGVVHSRSTTHAGAASPQRTGVLAGERGASSYPAAEPTASRSGTTFGLSGADLAYILLAAAALVVTGAFTRRIARTRTAKGHG